MHKNKGIHMATFLLLVIGGLNWLLFGLFGWDVGQLFGGMDAPVSRIIYVLVGLSAIYELAMHKSTCRLCKKENDDMQTEKATSTDSTGEVSQELSSEDVEKTV